MIITFNLPFKTLIQKIQSTLRNDFCDMIVTVDGPIIDQDGKWIYCQKKNVENRHVVDGQEEKRGGREGRWEVEKQRVKSNWFVRQE